MKIDQFHVWIVFYDFKLSNGQYGRRILADNRTKHKALKKARMVEIEEGGIEKIKNKILLEIQTSLKDPQITFTFFELKMVKGFISSNQKGDKENENPS
jgi:hypothetical protein